MSFSSPIINLPGGMNAFFKRSLFLLYLVCSASTLFASESDILESLLVTKTEKGRIPLLRELIPLTIQTNTIRARGLALDLLQFSKKYKDQQGEADAWNFLSETNMLTVMDFIKATEYAENALKISEQINYTRGIGNSYANIGDVLRKQKNYSKAMDYFRKSLLFNHNANDLARFDNQAAKIFTLKLMYDSAYCYYSRSLDLYKKLQDKYAIAKLMNNMADLFIRENKNEQADSLLKGCIELAHKSAPRMEALAYSTLSELAIKTGNYEKGLVYIDRSNEVAARLKINDYLLENYKVKSEVLTLLKKYKEALEYLTKYDNLKDTLFNSKNTLRINDFETGVALDKKQKEVDLAESQLQNQARLHMFLLAGAVFVAMVILVLIRLIRKGHKKTLEIERLDEEIEQTTKNITLLSDIGKEITSTLDLEKIFSIVYNRVNKLMDARTFGIGLYSAENHSIEYRMAIQDGVAYKPYFRDTLDKNQLPVWCIDNKKPVFINDFDKEYTNYITAVSHIDLETDGIQEKKTQSYIYIPLFVKKEVKGILTVQSYDKNAYSDNDLRIITAIASYSSIAIQNSNIFNHVEEMVAHRTYQLNLQKEEVDRAFQNIKLLSKIGQEISSTLNLEQILETTYQRVNSLMDANVFIIGIYNEKEHTAEGIFGIEKSERLPHFSTPINTKNSFASWCIVNKKEIFINDWEKESLAYLEEVPVIPVGERSESIIYIPLIVDEKTIGYITAQSFRKNAYTERDQSILRTISSYASVSLYNSKLYAGLEDKVVERTLEIHKQKEEIESAFNNIKLLAEIGQQITSTLDLEKVLKIVYDNVNRMMDATSFLIGYYDAEKNLLEMKLGMEKGERIPYASFDMTDKNRLAVKCIESGQELFTNNWTEDYHTYFPGTQRAKPLSGSAVESIIYIPLFVDDKIVGLITVQSYKTNAYTQLHLEILRSFASYTAVALNNAEAYKSLNQLNIALGEKKEELEEKKKEIEESNRNLTLLTEMGKEIISTLSIEQILEKVYGNVNYLMDASAFGIGIYNETENVLDFPGFIEKSETLEFHNVSIKEKDCLPVICFANNREIVINDIEEELPKILKTDKKPIAGEVTLSVIYLPLIHKGKTVGVLTVQSFNKNAYTSYHVELLRNLAVYAAIAIENANLYKKHGANGK